MSDRISEFQVLLHGIDLSQYFQGCGTAFTQYSGVVTGAGSNPREAFDDALEQLAQMGYDIPNSQVQEMIREAWGKRKRTAPTRPSTHRDEMYYYLSIRFNQAEPDVVHEVIVGNIGTVYHGKDRGQAELQYNQCCKISANGPGRAKGELVTWLVAGEIHKEFQPLVQPSEDEVMDAINGCPDDLAQHAS